jgi:hypothetical protein
MAAARGSGIAALEFNGPDIAAPHPRLPQLIGGRAKRIVAGINRRAAGEHREVAIPWGAVVSERA